jgi:RNA polymerase sigma-70 factor (ECF subfamily)
MVPRDEKLCSAEAEDWFATTHWSVVLAAGHAETPTARAALESLCQLYWYPLYAYARRRGFSVEDAQDLTQAFFARLLEKQSLEKASPARGRFRAFLITSLKNFLANEWDKAHAARRGSGQRLLSRDARIAEERYLAEPADEQSPDKLFERRWAVTLLESVLRRLREDYARGGRGELFERLKDFLWGEKNLSSYSKFGTECGMSEGAVKVAVHRLRRRYRDLLREEVAHTVTGPEEIEEELRHLRAVLKS